MKIVKESGKYIWPFFLGAVVVETSTRLFDATLIVWIIGITIAHIYHKTTNGER